MNCWPSKVASSNDNLVAAIKIRARETNTIREFELQKVKKPSITRGLFRVLAERVTVALRVKNPLNSALSTFLSTFGTPRIFRPIVHYFTTTELSWQANSLGLDCIFSREQYVVDHGGDADVGHAHQSSDHNQRYT